MNLNDSSKAIELQIVNYEHGWGQKITYTYREGGLAIPDISAMFQEGHLGKDADEGAYSVERDEAIFFSVDLPTKPIKGDKITTADAQDWYVDYLTGTKPYDIYCVANVAHVTGRSKRRER